MEPIKIQIELSFNEDSLSRLSGILAGTAAALLGALKNGVTPTATPEAAAPVAEPVSSDKNGDNEPLPWEPSDDEVMEATRKAVARCKAHGTTQAAKFIREGVFAQYGITKSTDCPPEQRAALIRDLDEIFQD